MTQTSASTPRTSIPRVRSVRLKAGGAQVTIFNPPVASPGFAALLASARALPEHFKRNMTGYLILVWDDTLTTTLDWQNTSKTMPTSAIPSVVAERVRHSVFDEWSNQT